MGETAMRHGLGALLLAITVLLSLFLLPASGTSDVGIWLRWSDIVNEQGLVQGYATSVGRFPANEYQYISGGGEYPPLAYTILFTMRELSELIGLDAHGCLKVVILAFYWVTIGLVLALSRSALLAAGFGAAMLIPSVGLAYIDIFYAPFLIGGFWFLRAERPVAGMALFAVAALVKWQPLAILPFVAVYLLAIGDLRSVFAVLRRPVFWRLTALAAAVLAFLVLAFGPWPFRALVFSLNHPYFSGNALNLAWLESFAYKLLFMPPFGFGSELTFVRPPALYHLPNKLVFWVAYLALLVRFARSQRSFGGLMLFATLGLVTYCTLNTGVHENHLSLGVVLAFVLLMHDASRANQTIALLLAVMLNVNVFLFHGVAGERVHSPVVGMDLSVPMAALFVAVWALLALYVWRTSTARVPQHHRSPTAALSRDNQNPSFVLPHSRMFPTRLTLPHHDDPGAS